MKNPLATIKQKETDLKITFGSASLFVFSLKSGAEVIVQDILRRNAEAVEKVYDR